MEYGVQKDVFEKIRELSDERKNLLIDMLSQQAEKTRSSRKTNDAKDEAIELFAQEIALKSLARYAQSGGGMREGDTLEIPVMFPVGFNEDPIFLKLIITYEGAVTFSFDSVAEFAEIESDSILKYMREGIHFYRLPQLVVTPLGFAVVAYEALRAGASGEAFERLTRIEKFFGKLLDQILEQGYASVGGNFEAMPLHRIQKNLSMSLFKSELLHQTSHTESAMDIFLKEVEGSFGVSFEECRKLLDFIGVSGRNTRWLTPNALYDLCYRSQSLLFQQVYPTQSDMIDRMYDYFSIQSGRSDRMFLTKRELNTRETTALRRTLKTKNAEYLSKEAYSNLSKRGKISTYSFIPSRMSYEARQIAERFVRTPSTENADFLGAERYNRRIVFSLRAAIEFLMAENFSDDDIASIIRPVFEHFELQKFLLDDETIEWALLRISDLTDLQDVLLMRGLLIGQRKPHEDEERQKDIESLSVYFAAHPGVQEGVRNAKRAGRKFTERDLRKHAPDLSEIFDYPDRKIEELGGVAKVEERLKAFRQEVFPQSKTEIALAVSKFVDYSREHFMTEVASSKMESIESFDGVKHHLDTLLEQGKITQEKYDTLDEYANQRFLANGIFEDELEELKAAIEQEDVDYNGWIPMLTDKGEIRHG